VNANEQYFEYCRLEKVRNFFVILRFTSMVIFKKCMLLMILVMNTGVLFAGQGTVVSDKEQDAINFVSRYGSWQQLNVIKNKLNGLKKLTIDDAVLPELRDDADKERIKNLQIEVDKLKISELVQYLQKQDHSSSDFPYKCKFVYECAKSADIQDWFKYIEQYCKTVQIVLHRAIKAEDLDCVEKLSKLVNPNEQIYLKTRDFGGNEQLNLCYVYECIPRSCNDNVKQFMILSFLKAGLKPEALLNKLSDFKVNSSLGTSPEMVRFLLQQGVPYDQPDEDGHTPLMYAALSGGKEHVALLLQRGADKNLKDKDGDTAADIARQRGRKDIVELLENYGKPVVEPLSQPTNSADEVPLITSVTAQPSTADESIDLLQAAAREGEKLGEQSSMEKEKKVSEAKYFYNRFMGAMISIIKRKIKISLSSIVPKEPIFGGAVQNILDPYGKKIWQAPIDFKSGRILSLTGCAQ
jgi:hypothetical protein